MDDMGVAPTAGADDDLDQLELDEHTFNERDRAILDFERTWWKYEGAKTTAIRERFGLSPTRYYCRLSWILDRPEALEHDILTTKRLLRLRTDRRRQRSDRGRGFELG